MAGANCETELLQFPQALVFLSITWRNSLFNVSLLDFDLYLE